MDLTVVVHLKRFKSYSILEKAPQGVRIICVGDDKNFQEFKESHPSISAEFVQNTHNLDVQTEFFTYFLPYEFWGDHIWEEFKDLCVNPDDVCSRCGLGFIKSPVRVQYAIEYQPELMKPLQLSRNVWFPIDFSPVCKYVYHTQLIRNYSLSLNANPSVVDMALFDFDYHMIMYKEIGHTPVIYEPLAFSTNKAMVTQIRLMQKYRRAMYDKLDLFTKPFTKLWLERRWILRNKEKYLMEES